MNCENLHAKITARNNVNASINIRAAAMREAVRPLIGTKICKADGTLTKKAREALPVCPNTPAEFAYYTTGSGYTLRACFRSAVAVPNSGTQYAEADVYLCDLSDGFATNLYPTPTEARRTDYTLSEVYRIQKDLREAQSKVSSLQSELAAIL